MYTLPDVLLGQELSPPNTRLRVKEYCGYAISHSYALDISTPPSHSPLLSELGGVSPVPSAGSPAVVSRAQAKLIKDMFRVGCPLAKDRPLSRSRAVHCGPGVADELLPCLDSPVIQCHPSMGRDVTDTRRPRKATPKQLLLRRRYVTPVEKSDTSR